MAAWQQLPGASTATPGLTWLCLPVHIQGGRYLANPTLEKLLHGAGAGLCPHLAQAGLPMLPSQVEPQHRHVPRGTWHITSGLRHYQEHRQGQTQQQGNTESGLRGAPLPTDRQGKEGGTNGTDYSHREVYQSSNHRLKIRAWRKKLERIYQV